MMILNILLSVLTILPMQGSYLEQLQQRDSVLIADQLHYGVELKQLPMGTGLAFPDWSKEFCEGVEVLGDWQLDTVKLYKQKNATPLMDLKAHLTIVSFDDGEYELPPIYMQRMNPGGAIDTLVFNPQKLEVRTMPVDTTSFVPHDIKAQIRYPLTFMEVAPYIAGALLLAGLIVLIVFLCRKYRKKKEEAARKEPAHIIALRELDKYRGSKLWAADKQKLFYSGVTDVLRTYISERYGIGAMEMTTAEIFEDMCRTDVPVELQAALKELFERADFVKFAKHVASDEENAQALPLAVRFVTTTYQAELDAAPETAATGNADGAETASGQTAGTSAESTASEPVKEKDPNEAYMPK